MSEGEPIKIGIDSNYFKRFPDIRPVAMARYDAEMNSIAFDCYFENPKDEDDDLSISFDVSQLLSVIGRTIKEPMEY